MPKGVIIGVLVAALGINCEERPAGVWFTDVAAERGLTSVTTFGDRLATRSILESTGTGALIFDYDGDGSNDIFVVGGTTFDKAEAPSHRSQLYRNDGRGHFTEVGQKAGLTRVGWGQAACWETSITTDIRTSWSRTTGETACTGIQATGPLSTYRSTRDFRCPVLGGVRAVPSSITTGTATWIFLSPIMWIWIPRTPQTRTAEPATGRV